MAEPAPDNSIDDLHKNGIIEFVNENVPSGDPAEMVEFMFNNWRLVIDRLAMIDGAKERRINTLKAERSRQDDERAELDAEIDRLEGERTRGRSGR